MSADLRLILIIYNCDGTHGSFEQRYFVVRRISEK